MVVGEKSADEIFKDFSSSLELSEIIHHFRELCTCLQIDPRDHHSFYGNLKAGLHQVSQGRSLWRVLDRRADHPEYKDQSCQNAKMLVIGAGPCGLRMAIEGALLGAKVVVAEAREYLGRNNVLHLWPLVIHDMRSIGAKVFFPRFCTGSLDHVSIKRMQTILLKVALVLGVDIQVPVKYQSLVEPANEGVGWRARFSPEDHPLNNYEFDVIVGADGRGNSIKEFKRQEFRGKLAIAITANFVNYHSREENAVEEIGGLFYIYNPEFFENLREQAGIELENFVYFKDDTHYFVMTAKKQSLLHKGVLKKDYQDVGQLLSRSNVNRERLLEYAQEVAELSTKHSLPHTDFAQNHHGQEDVAIFDFTNLQHADNSSMAIEKHGRRLLMTLVGDTLNEPFWPTGSGCARGFLSVLDAAWMMRNWFLGQRSPLEVIAERESVYKLLTQTAPDNLNNKYSKWTIDPQTRYGGKLKPKPLKPGDVRHLYVSSHQDLLDRVVTFKPPLPVKPASVKRGTLKRKREGTMTLNTKQVLAWYRELLQHYQPRVDIKDLTSSWADGVAFCAVVHHHRPDLIDINDIKPDDPRSNVKQALEVIEKEFGVSPVLTADDIVRPEGLDRLGMLSYLTIVKEVLENPQMVKLPKLVRKPTYEKKTRSLKRQASTSAGMLVKVNSSIKRKKSIRKIVKKEGGDGSWRTNTLKACKERGLARQRIKALEQANKAETSMPPALKKRELPVSETCCVCRKRVFIVERQSILGLFFHRECYRCSQCNVPLRLGSEVAHIEEKKTVKFFCSRHAPEQATPSVEELDWEMESDEDADDTALQDHKKKWRAVTQMISALHGMMQPTPAMMSMMSAAGLVSGGGQHQGEDSTDSGEVSSEDDELSRGMMMMGMTDTGEMDTSLQNMDTLKFSTLAKSVRFLKGYEIQRELGEMEDQELELEERGLEVEKTLRRRRFVSTGAGPDAEELEEEWIEVLREQQELKQKQSELLLEAKMLELQDKQLKVLSQWAACMKSEEQDDERHLLSEATGGEPEELEELEAEMQDNNQVLQDIRDFMDNIGCSEV